MWLVLILSLKMYIKIIKGNWKMENRLKQAILPLHFVISLRFYLYGYIPRICRVTEMAHESVC